MFPHAVRKLGLPAETWRIFSYVRVLLSLLFAMMQAITETTRISGGSRIRENPPNPGLSVLVFDEITAPTEQRARKTTHLRDTMSPIQNCPELSRIAHHGPPSFLSAIVTFAQ